MRRASEEVKNQAHQLHDQGLSLRKIAEKVGFSEGAVWGWINPDAVQRSRDRNRERQNQRRNEAFHERYWGDAEFRQNRLASDREAHKRRYADNPEKFREKSLLRYYDHLEQYMLSNARKRARDRDLEFCLSLEEIIIPDCCPYLGIPIIRERGGLRPDSPSLDRIDPTKGYISGNVIVVSHMANAMKNSASPLEFIAMAKRLEKLIQTDERFDQYRINGGL